jgi:hypothetical protein
MAGATQGDDRILPFTRVAAAVVIAILILATIILFFMPSSTDHRFAWTIDSTMTAMLMGAGYGSALYFFVRVLTERHWHRVGLGFLATTLFTWMMLGATFLHWDKFHHGTAPFLLWLWVYIVTAVLVPVVFLVNRGHASRVPEDRDAAFPAPIRSLMIAAGVVMLAIAAWMYVLPDSAIAHWPWALTPLTSRAVAAFVALPGVGWLAIASDPRWSAARVMLGTVAIGLVALLVAVVRAWSQFDRGNPLCFVYVAGLVGTLAAVGGLALFMRALSEHPVGSEAAVRSNGERVR